MSIGLGVRSLSDFVLDVIWILHPDSIYFDFLQTYLYFSLIKRPSLLREMILAQDNYMLTKPIILDEVQKIPHILDEVHWLIENKGLQFVLCGSSARKLKRGQANLLGGLSAIGWWSIQYILLTLTYCLIIKYKQTIIMVRKNQREVNA